MVEAILHLSLQQAECARGPSFKTLLSTLTGSLAKLPPALPLNLKIPSLRPGRPGTGPLRCVYGGFIEDGMFQLLPFHYSDVRSGCGLHSRLVAKPERMFCRAANLKSSPPPPPQHDSFSFFLASAGTGSISAQWMPHSSGKAASECKCCFSSRCHPKAEPKPLQGSPPAGPSRG